MITDVKGEPIDSSRATSKNIFNSSRNKLRKASLW
jgi:hypothetical protein